MPRRLRLPLLVGVGLLVLVGLEFVPFYTDWLWFQEIGHPEVFLRILSLRGTLFLLAGLGGFLFLHANLRLAARARPPDVFWELEEPLGLPSRLVLEPFLRRVLTPILALIALAVGIRASAEWEGYLRFANAGPFGVTDPFPGWLGFGRDVGFYVFRLPFWRLLVEGGLLLTALALLLTVLLYFFQRVLVLTARGPLTTARARTHLLILLALLLGWKALDFHLATYDLLFSPRGVVFGAAYADVHASLPALRLLTVLAALAAVFCLTQIVRRGWRPLLATLVVLALAWIGGLGVYPSLVQRFRVVPNELAAEREYIAHAIRFTRQAYALHRIEERDFPAKETLRAEDLARNEATIRNIRLWDHRPLLATYAQLQEIRTYYKFVDVDNDRYALDGEYRQLILSARELSNRHIPEQTQGGVSWVNEHLTYTHGYGVVVGPVTRVSPEGLPEFFAKDIPPLSSVEALRVSRPEIYYGELGNRYVLVRTRALELDYPSGDKNVYSTYRGDGGVPVGTLLRRLLFAVRFASKDILFNRDLLPESRIMYHRRIEERVRKLAPFLRFDRDPYLVITGDGRLVWIIDAYTVTDRYPYSEPLRGWGNYLRNSVKAVVDAYHGSVSLYLADPTDPLIQAYRRAFPRLFRPLAELPPDVAAHLRYPQDLFSIQARMYATYHMEDPQVFYNREDLWAIPRKAEGGGEREMEPYYTIMRLPDEPRAEFILLIPFTPSRRDNMIAWLAARSDPPHYGKLVAFIFPKQKLVYGPRQIEARIDQDAFISQQISLWSQRGSAVIRGNLLAIPIEESLIYVEPLYLAAEKGSIPELKRVIVAFGNQIAMEETLERSLEGIFGQRGPVPEAPRVARPPAPSPDQLGALVGQAWEAWGLAREHLRRGEWAAYGEALGRLEEALRRLRERTGR